jgi:hypothetical protein
MSYCRASRFAIESKKIMRFVMTRITLIAFVLLTGYFYTTGKSVDENGPQINSFTNLAGQKTTVADARLSRTSGQLLHVSKAQTGGSRSDGLNQTDEMAKLIQSSWDIGAAAPELPARNPRRLVSPSPRLVVATHKSSLSLIKAAALVKPKTRQIFGEVRNKVTSASVKPLAINYQQRYLKTHKSVLGPRLTAVLVKRELRRVGCYRGNVTSSWNKDARTAIETFNLNTGAKLPSERPTVRSLEKIQKVTKIVCSNKINAKRRVIADVSPGLGTSKTKSLKKAEPWRGKVQRQIKQPNNSTRRALPIVAPLYKSNRKMRLVGTYNSHIRIKRRRRARIYPHWRSKKYRIARRKARRRPLVRSWRRHNRPRKFGFKLSGGSFSDNN